MNGRFFAFGCSFTRYFWPTWADIVGKEFSDYQNWGRPGAGNQFIFNSIIECHLKNQFKSSDTIGIMWTNISREDRYVNNSWNTPGNIHAQNGDNIENIRGYFIRDLALIYAIVKLLDSIGCRYYFFSMVPLTNCDQYAISNIDNQISDILPYYKETLDIIRPSVYETIFNNDWWSRPFLPTYKHAENKYNSFAGEDWPTFAQFIAKKFTNIKDNILEEIFDKSKWDWDQHIRQGNRIDLHPTPCEHLEYVDKIFPEIIISPETRNWVDIEEQKVQNKIKSPIEPIQNRW